MIRERDLGTLTKLGEGGYGEVFAVPSFALPGFPGPLAYKRPKSDAPPKKRSDILEAMVASVEFRDRLTQADQAVLDEHTAWPLVMVEDGAGQACGLLMPLLTGDFMLSTKPANGSPDTVLFELAWLSAKDDHVKQQGIDRSAIMDPVVRLTLLAKLVYIVAWLHKRQVVYGDISVKNVVVAVNPPRIKLIDCDGSSLVSNSNRVATQGHSPFFQPPECPPGQKQDFTTDVYKLGLCVIRGLQWGPGIQQTRKPDTQTLSTILNPAGITMLRQTMGSPGGRPAAKDLYRMLFGRLGDLVAAPDLVDASLSRRAMPRGMEVRVNWTVAHAERIVVTGAQGLHVEVDPVRFPTGISVTPRGTGDIEVEAFNPNGSVSLTAGFVDLYELPIYNVNIPHVPALRVPPLPEVDLPEVLSSLPAVPAVSALQNPVPRIESPSLEPILEALRPVTGMTSPFLRVDSVVADGFEQVQATVAAGIRDGFDVIDLEKLTEAARAAAERVTAGAKP